MPLRKIVLATRNAGKVREISQVLGSLGVALASLAQFPDIPEPEEHGDTFAANAREKALYYARATGQWCLADDSGLVVDALGGRPGVRSARYAAENLAAGLRQAQSSCADRGAVDQANNAKLLRELEGIPDQLRTARFTCHLALADAHRVLLEASGSVEGMIGREPFGDNGFGYDPLFVVTSHGRTSHARTSHPLTMAQLPADEKNRISHRGQALRNLAAMLAELLID